jgi:PAS domain S-box-containing protein
LDGVITSWNAAAERLYGYPRREAIGQSLSKVLEASEVSDWPHIRGKLQEDEQIALFDGFHRAKDGHSIDVAVTISPVRDGAGRIIGASTVARDVSERRRADRKAALLLG